jgi:hypothetical protein
MDTYDNAVSTKLFEDAILIVERQKVDSSDIGTVAKLTLISATLECVKLYSVSCNDIAGLRGLGFESATALAKKIIAAGTVNIHTMRMNYRIIIENFN